VTQYSWIAYNVITWFMISGVKFDVLNRAHRRLNLIKASLPVQGILGMIADNTLHLSMCRFP